MSARFRAFGLAVEANFQLAGSWPEEDASEADLRLELAPASEAWSGAAGPALWTTVMDARQVSIEPGAAGDHLIRYGDSATFWLAPGADALHCEPAEPAEPAWQRFLLDTVLLLTSQLRGFTALHAGAVEHGGRAIAFVGVMGGGKTSLVAELVARGHSLFCDDILAFEARPREVVAYPGPPLMNLPLAHDPESLGSRLADFEDESWVEVANACATPRPLGAVFLLDRSARWSGVEAAPLDPNPMHLIPHTVGLQTGAHPRRARFSALADLASHVPMLRLRAGLDQPPEALADGVLGSLAEPAVVA